MKLCAIHNVPKVEYVGFNARPGDPNNPWDCPECAKAGVVQEEADPTDTLPISYPSTWDMSWDVTAEIERKVRFQLANNILPGHNSYTVRVNNTLFTTLFTLTCDDCDWVIYCGTIPTQGAQAGAQPAAKATSPSLQPQHSTLSPLVVTSDPGVPSGSIFLLKQTSEDVELSLYRTPDGEMISLCTPLQQGTDHLRTYSKTKQSAENFLWYAQKEVLRNIPRSGKSNATSYHQTDQKKVDALFRVNRMGHPASKKKT